MISIRHKRGTAQQVQSYKSNAKAGEIVLDTDNDVAYVSFRNGSLVPISSGGGGGETVDWDDITNKPSTYTPSVHNHTIGDITNLQNTLDGKQTIIADLSTIRSNSTNGASAYTTIQSYGDVVTHNASEFLTQHQDISGKANTADLGAVAFSNSYNDLDDKPTIPSAVTESTVSGWGFTKNTGTVTSVNNTSPINGDVTINIPVIPTNVSTFTNDAGYLTQHQDISGKANNADLIALDNRVTTLEGEIGQGSLCMVDWTRGYKLTIPSTGTSTASVNTTYTLDWQVLDNYFGTELKGVVLRVRHDSNSAINTVPYFALGLKVADGVTTMGDVDDNGIVTICHLSSYLKSGQMLSTYCEIPRGNRIGDEIILAHRATDLSYAWLHPVLPVEEL